MASDGLTTIGELLAKEGGSIKTGPFGTVLKAKEYGPDGVPLISVGEIGYGTFRVTPSTPRAPRAVVERLPEYLLETNDIVFGRKGAVDRSAIVKPEQAGWFLGSDGIRLRLPKTCDANFVAYQLQSPEVRAWLCQHATGTTMASLNQNIIERIPVVLPPLVRQRVAAQILGRLDGKIQLNLQMNETLEAMARALFKSWFIDFDPVRAKAEGRDTELPERLTDMFPASFEDSELGEIPKGWTAETVGTHLQNYDSKRIPVSGSERAKRPGPYPYHGAAGVMDYVHGYLFDGIHLLVGEDGSVMQDNGNAVTQYVWGRFWVNNHAHVLQGLGSVSTEQLYLHFQFEPVRPYVTGAVQPKLSQGRMNAIPFVFAGKGICGAFAEIVRPWFAKLRSNTEETNTLATIRDALLPKLISGELRVKDAEKFMEARA